MKTQWNRIEREVAALLRALKPDIGDDYRAHEDDDKPGMQVTIATTDGQSWAYQTGDNSYTGGCYSHPHWAVIYLHRRSNCRELARDAVTELADAVAQAAEYAR